MKAYALITPKGRMKEYLFYIVPGQRVVVLLNITNINILKYFVEKLVAYKIISIDLTIINKNTAEELGG